MEDIKLEEIDIKEFKEDIYIHYVEAFPEEERKPFSLIKNTYDRGYMKLIKILNNDSLLGFMILNRIKNNGYAVLDYFAILPQYRNKGFGTKALKLLLEKEKNSSGIFIEIEKVGLGINNEDNLIREKRKKFYEEIGFKKLKFDLLLFGVIFMPYIFSNIDINEEKIIKEILNIYESICGKESIEQNCKIIS